MRQSASLLTKPTDLNLLQPQHCPNSQANGVFWPSAQSERSSCHYTGRVNYSLSRLRDRCLFDSSRSGVFLHSAPGDLCCGARVPHHHQCLIGLRNKVTFVYAHTKPAVLILPQPWHCPNSQANGVFWPSVQSEESSCHYTDSANSL